MHRNAMPRRLAALAALGVISFTAAACSDDAGAPAASVEIPSAGATVVPPAPVDPSVAASADKALTSNTQAICAQAARTTTNFGETFIADIKLRSDAASKGAAAKQQAQQKIDRDVANFSYALTDMAKLTTDPQLKKALTGMSKQVTVLKGDITKIDTEKMSQLTATLDKACGKG